MRKLTPTRMAKTDTYEMLDRMQSNRINNTLLVGVKKVQSFGKVLKLKPIIQLPYGTTIPYLGVYTREIKTCSQKTCIRMTTIPKIFITIKTWNSPGDFQQEMGSEAYLYNRVWPSKNSSKCNNMYEYQDYMNEILPKSIFYTVLLIWNSKIRKMSVGKNWIRGCLQEMEVGINWKGQEITFAA